MAKEYKVAFRLGAELESSFNRTLSRASGDFKALQQQIRTLTGGRAIAGFTRPVREDVHKTQGSIRRLLGETRGWQTSLGRMAGVAGAGAFAFSSLRKSMDFEEQMSSIQAVGGLTRQQMSDVQKLALDMGAKTKYSALEAGRGMEELIKAGMSTNKVIGGGLEAALNLAAAGGLELADSAEIMSTAMNAFKKDGIAAHEAANMLAGTANASATGVMELKDSLAQASAVASGVGMSFKAANTALGVFANNGLKGSDAGTSLKTMLLNLTPQTKSAHEEFERLNLITFHSSKALQFLESKGIHPVSKSTRAIRKAMMEYAAQTVKAKVGTEKANKAFQGIAFQAEAMSSAFYDNRGKLKDISEMAGILRNALKDLNDEQRQVSMKTMFGTDAIRAANILYREGAEGVKTFHEEMSKVTALDVAKQKMDNAKGAVEQFQGAMETLQISVLTPMMPKIKQFALQAADASEKFGKWMNTKQAKEWGETLLFVGKAGASMYATAKLGAFAYRASKVGKNLVNIAKTSGLLARAGGLIGAMSNPLGIAAVAAATCTASLVLLTQQQEKARQGLFKVKETLDTAFSDYHTLDERIQKTAKLTDEYHRLKTKIAESKTPVHELVEARRRLKDVEQQLIDLHPSILSAEDAKTGKFREGLEVIKKKNQIEEKLALRKLKHEFLTAKSKLPEIEKEQNRLVDKKSESQKSYEENEKRYGLFLDISNKQLEIEVNPNLSEREKGQKNEKLRVEVLQKENLRLDPSRFNSKDLALEIEYYEQQINDKKKILNEINRDIAKTDESKKTIYQKGIELIKTSTTGNSNYDIAKHAKEFYKLPEEGKKKFTEVIKAVAQLNREMKLIPGEIKIDIKPILDSTGLGQTTDWGKQEIAAQMQVKDLLGQSMLNPFGLMQTFGGQKSKPDSKLKPYANGGIITRPHMGLVGEAGPEIIIPLSASRRQRALGLYEKAGKWLGVQAYAAGGVVGQLPAFDVPIPFEQLMNKCKQTEQPSINQPIQITINNNPSIVIQGDADTQTAQKLKQVLQETAEGLKPHFERMLHDYYHQKRRVSMDGAL